MYILRNDMKDIHAQCYVFRLFNLNINLFHDMLDIKFRIIHNLTNNMYIIFGEKYIWHKKIVYRYLDLCIIHIVCC